jgi:hypothetical protein
MPNFPALLGYLCFNPVPLHKPELILVALQAELQLLQPPQAEWVINEIEEEEVGVEKVVVEVEA